MNPLEQPRGLLLAEAGQGSESACECRAAPQATEASSALPCAGNNSATATGPAPWNVATTMASPPGSPAACRNRGQRRCRQTNACRPQHRRAGQHQQGLAAQPVEYRAHGRRAQRQHGQRYHAGGRCAGLGQPAMAHRKRGEVHEQQILDGNRHHDQADAGRIAPPSRSGTRQPQSAICSGSSRPDREAAGNGAGGRHADASIHLFHRQVQRRLACAT